MGRLNWFTHRGQYWLRACILVVVFALVACASGSNAVHHSFGFDARVDSPDVLILDFRYGKSGLPSTSAATGLRQFDKSPQAAGIGGPHPIGDELYVKWQIKATQEVLEDTVNLKPLLPFSMYNKRIYFVVQGAQLHVYLIEDSIPRPADWPKLGPRKFQYEKTYQIYPTRLPK